MKKTLTVILVSALLLHSALSIAQQGSSSASHAQVEQITKVNINSADEDQLLLLKGVGHTKALAIINYRKAHGAFTHTDDLLNVKGIGQKVLVDNESRISI